MRVAAALIDSSPRAATDLVGSVMRAVNDHIRANSLSLGDPLPSESGFGEQLGVSRAVVREAFRSLTALGIIDAANGRRARVGAIEPALLGLVVDHAVHTDQISVQQIMDVRRTIETRTVVLAALRRSDKEAAQIADFAASMRRDVTRPEQVMEHDIAFHEAIAKACRNPMFALLVGSFHVVTRETWAIGWASRGREEARFEMIENHEAIARAIVNREPKAAEQAMADHFDDTVKALLAAGVN